MLETQVSNDVTHAADILSEMMEGLENSPIIILTGAGISTAAGMQVMNISA